MGDLVGPNPTDRGKKKGVKRSILVEAEGGPLAAVVAGANVHDTRLLAATLDAVVLERPDPAEEEVHQHLCLDKAYDNPTGAVRAGRRGSPQRRRVRVAPMRLFQDSDCSVLGRFSRGRIRAARVRRVVIRGSRTPVADTLVAVAGAGERSFSVHFFLARWAGPGGCLNLRVRVHATASRVAA